MNRRRCNGFLCGPQPFYQMFPPMPCGMMGCPPPPPGRYPPPGGYPPRGPGMPPHRNPYWQGGMYAQAQGDDMYGYYPMQMPMSDEEWEEDGKQWQWVQEMYPKMARRIQKKAKFLCEKLDYEGSILYDEYPDKLMLQRYSDGIFEEMQKELKEEKESQGISAETGNCEAFDMVLYELVEMILYYEVLRMRLDIQR